MRKIFSFILMLCVATLSGFAQINPQAPLELDKSVRTGKLDNGLTYYVMHNEKPAERADFYIVTNVGAIQETPDQDGLAHFLEHMCFNGTKHFPGKGIISYMESIGCAFGRNINAGTGFEQTSYMLNDVPVIRDGIIDSSLLILFDYAAHVTLDPKEIEAERGVILEEKRTRDGASWRQFISTRKALFKGSKFENCTLIGSEENLKTFKPQSLINFYKTWYRPDMQAIIVVGDVDVDAVENKIKTLFSQIPKAENPQAKEVIIVPDNKEPIVSIFTDKELSSTSIMIMEKSEPLPQQFKGTGIYIMNDLMESLVSAMGNERLDDLSKQPNAPFLNAGIGFNNLSATLNAFGISVATKDGEALKGLEAVATEVERMKRYGFTEDEYSRAKTNILRALETAKNNAASRQNSQLVYPLISHFTENEPYMTPEYRYETIKAYAEQIPLALINQAVKELFKEENIVVLYSAPEKEGLVNPTEADLLSTIGKAKTAEIEAPKQTTSNEPLLDASALKGSKVKKESKGEFGTTIWKLKNGIEVIIKPTEYKKDEVLVKSTSKGGSSLFPEELLPSFESTIFNTYLSNAGISKFPKTQLDKMLTGKVASFSPYISSREQGVSASGSPKDLETMLQGLYLLYTAPRFEKAEFEVGFNQIKSILPNVVNQPNFAFNKAITTVMYGNSPRKPILDEGLLDKVSIENIKKGYETLFADAAGTKVYITGNVKLDEIKPLVEKYIGSLPVKSKKGKMWVDENVRFPKGIVDNTFAFPMKTPKTSIALLYSGVAQKSLFNDLQMEILTSVMDQLYTKTIREDEGGTYGVSTFGGISKYPIEEIYLGIVFDTEEAKSVKLIELAKQGFKDVAEKGPNPEYVNKAKENLIKSFPESQIRNGYWHNLIYQYYTNEMDNYTDYVKTVESITPETIKQFAADLINQGNRSDVIMNPKKSE
jgi:Predicted Zn-dependent peptidases